MLSWKLVVTLIIFAVIFILYVWHRVLKRNLILKYALLWLLFCISIPKFLKIICNIIGISTVSNFIFLIGFGLLLFITFILTEIVSTQKAKITSLAQEIAILKDKGEKENE